MVKDLDPFDEEDMAIQEIEQKYKLIEDQIEELYKKIKEYQTQITVAKDRGDAETLSNTLIRLARVNTAYGRKASYAMYVARNAERAYRRAREQKKLAAITAKNAIGKADSMAYVDEMVGEIFSIYSEVLLLAETASDTAYRTDTFMKMSQSALSLIKNEINGGRP